MQECSQDSMALFADWFVKVVGSERNAEDFRQELKTYYATAFEFVAIGATFLERDTGKLGKGSCPKSRASRH